MNSDLMVALVAAIAAVMGALLGAVPGLLMVRSQRRREVSAAEALLAEAGESKADATKATIDAAMSLNAAMVSLIEPYQQRVEELEKALKVERDAREELEISARDKRAALSQQFERRIVTLESKLNQQIQENSTLRVARDTYRSDARRLAAQVHSLGAAPVIQRDEYEMILGGNN